MVHPTYTADRASCQLFSAKCYHLASLFGSTNKGNAMLTFEECGWRMWFFPSLSNRDSGYLLQATIRTLKCVQEPSDLPFALKY